MNQNYQTTASHFSCVTNIWIWLHPDALHITTAPTCDCQTSDSNTSEKQGFARIRCWATGLRPSGGGWGRVLDTNLCSQMSLRTWCVHSQCYCHVYTRIYIKIDILLLCKIHFLVTRPTLSNQHWGLLKRRSCLLGETHKTSAQWIMSSEHNHRLWLWWCRNNTHSAISDAPCGHTNQNLVGNHWSNTARGPFCIYLDRSRSSSANS